MNNMKYVRNRKNTVRCSFCCKEMPRTPEAILKHNHDKIVTGSKTNRTMMLHLVSNGRSVIAIFKIEIQLN